MSEENFPLCDCGCGKEVTKKTNKYLWGHNKNVVTDETRQKLRDANLGITLEMRHGEEKAKEIKRKIGLKSKERIPYQKGKTWEELYSKEGSEKLRERLKETHTNNPIFKDRKGPRNPYYKGAKDSLYKHWSPKITEDKNRENKDKKIEVKCTYCGKWYVPTQIELDNRIGAVRKNNGIGCNFYCSGECKKLCPDHYQVLWPKNHKPYNIKKDDTPNLTNEHGHNFSVEVNPLIRKLVFERDNWECQRCNVQESLQCHHIDPIALNPGFANDIDSCITLCIECHQSVHKTIEGCGYNDLKNEKQNRIQGCPEKQEVTNGEI